MHDLNPVEAQKAVSWSNSFLLLASVLLVVLVVGGVGTQTWMYLQNPCDVAAVAEASAFLDIQLKSYDRVYQSAVSGTPTSLTYPVTVLQQILVDTQTVTVPACVQAAKDQLLGYMDVVIRAFQAYAAGEKDLVIRNLINESNQHYAHFYWELEAVNKCAPFCIRE